MEVEATIKQMLAGNQIFVPTYQRAYSWDTELESKNLPKQVNDFLTDLENHIQSETGSKYYFGHFLFEEKSKIEFGVIDGQQRLTTIVIFLSALFSRLKQTRDLTEREVVIREDIIKRKSTYRFKTVDYDNQLFKDYVIDRKDYVIDQIKRDKDGLETVSANRIVTAFDFFVEQLKDKDETYLRDMLETVQNASCTTHSVKDVSEAIQMFIFQNNRGKRPTHLEIIKAQFMFNVHLYGREEKESLIKEIEKEFETIYKSISSIEHRINENDVLVYTLRVHFNSLWETGAIDRINRLLAEGDPIPFIKSFTRSLATSFKHLATFFGEDERENIEIHSLVTLVTLGGIGTVMPFIIKAYKFGLDKSQFNQLCIGLESMILRIKLIETRADITSRMNDVYQGFTNDNPDIKPIVDRIDWLKSIASENWGSAYWNNGALERDLQGRIHSSTAKYLLWKYENHLRGFRKSDGNYMRFDKIEGLKQPYDLEHIAPQTENPKAGYDTYDEEFTNEYLDCLGNYLLLSESLNRAIGNMPFKDKCKDYTELEQQKEIKNMTKANNPTWTRDLIQKRKDKIIKFIMESEGGKVYNGIHNMEGRINKEQYAPNSNQWIWENRCLVHDYKIEGYDVAIDTFLTHEGQWGITLFDRLKSSNYVLKELGAKFNLKRNADGNRLTVGKEKYNLDEMDEVEKALKDILQKMEELHKETSSGE